MFQITGAVIAVVYLIVGTLTSTNSTASVGFFFIPVAAALGGFTGDALKHYVDVLRKKRRHSIGKTVFLVMILVVCGSRFIRFRAADRQLSLLEDPSLSAESLEKVLESHLTDYSVMSRIARRPDLGVSKMEKIVALERSDFEGDAEYEVYQTYVWAPLAQREDIPEDLIHKLAAKSNPGHFLILALLDSRFLSCEERARFLPQPNPVLEDAIRRSLTSHKCSR
jgi:hypothetical protein